LRIEILYQCKAKRKEGRSHVALGTSPSVKATHREVTKMNKKPHTKATVDRESVRCLAIELGAREAARRTGINPNTIFTWARRYQWNLPKRESPGRPRAELESIMKASPGDILLSEHKSLEAKTKTGLSRAVAKAAEHASTQPPLEVRNTSQLRDLAASAARIFGWDKAPQTNVQVNTLRITAEQLAEIRALRDAEGLP
jgi:hypothetical protein